MVNRRAYFRLLLINFAAAAYNLAAQWMTHMFVVDLGPKRSLIGVFLPALIALVLSALILHRKPRGIDSSVLAGALGIQVAIWILVLVDIPYGLPLVLMWLQLFLVLTYAILSWKMLLESYKATVTQNSSNLNKGV